MGLDIAAMIAAAQGGGWQQVFAAFDQAYPRVATEQQASFTDKFYTECLHRLVDPVPTDVVWQIALRWHARRNLSLAGYEFSSAEGEVTLQFQRLLRDKLGQRLAASGTGLPAVPENVARGLIGLWSGVFLASYSILNQQDGSTGAGATADAAAPGSVADYYPWLLRMSMVHPFGADRFAVDVAVLLAADIPAYAKVILAMWLVNIPRYNATQIHRQKAIDYFQAVERETRKRPSWLEPFFHPLAEWTMTALFRMAYLHEDNSAITMRFGDFVASQMNRMFPAFAADFRKPEKGSFHGRRIRIGYVSSRFVANAVTFYMANRIFHRDAATFEVQVFALGMQRDGLTDLLAKHSDRFVRLENLLDYPGNAKVIRDSELDILIYADIGMHIPTYLLAGLRLAPVQAALLGHASPTGLPTLDYFFSSEVEPPHGQAHYREKLVRLPNVGASQLFPPGLRTGLAQPPTRQLLDIPADAFVFVSCANGMKHVPERDFIWTEILRRIPKAWILIKPFSPGDYDHKLVERIARAGERAGAPARIRYVSGFDGHEGVFGLLSLANVQLDTYPFNGWTTTIEAICLALPTVTQEGNGYRSRLGAGFLRAMGIAEGIGSNEDEYIEWAVKFANDPNLYQWTKNRIKAARQALLFDNRTLQLEYERALIAMMRDQAGRSE